MTAPTYPTLAGVGYSTRRTPIWQTRSQPAVSGKEIRLADWTYPRRRYGLTYDFLRSDSTNLEMQTLEGFFNQVNGAAGIFQYHDPDDNAVTGQSFGVGDGATTAFQLVRTFGGFVEPVFAPIGTPTVKINNVQTAGFSLGATGIVTFNAAPGNGAALTWTGTYNWLCRFDDDTTEFEQFMFQLYQLGKIKFTTVKL